jgi:membrane protein required for colicin V production
MQWIDWVIVIIMAAAMIGGMSQGFFRSAWNYGRVAKIFLPLVKLHAVADAIGFLLVALLVMAIFGILGAILAKAFRLIGLGCLDSLAGAIFGFFQGVILVTLGILALAAFFPDTQWLENARLPKLFFGACHLSTHVSPGELAHRVRDGLKILEHDSHELINLKPSGS